MILGDDPAVEKPLGEFAIDDTVGVAVGVSRGVICGVIGYIYPECLDTSFCGSSPLIDPLAGSDVRMLESSPVHDKDLAMD